MCAFSHECQSLLRGKSALRTIVAPCAGNRRVPFTFSASIMAPVYRRSRTMPPTVAGSVWPPSVRRHLYSATAPNQSGKAHAVARRTPCPDLFHPSDAEFLIEVLAAAHGVGASRQNDHRLRDGPTDGHDRLLLALSHPGSSADDIYGRIGPSAARGAVIHPMSLYQLHFQCQAGFSADTLNVHQPSGLFRNPARQHSAGVPNDLTQLNRTRCVAGHSSLWSAVQNGPSRIDPHAARLHGPRKSPRQ